MSHLQNKSYAYQQIQTRARECAITRSRYKMMEKQAEPDVYYSDEDDSNAHCQRNQFEDIIKQAQGQIHRTQVKEEPLGPYKTRKTRAQMKKKSSRSKLPPATPPTNTPDMPPIPAAICPPILEEAQESPQILQPEPVQVQKPYYNHQISFQTIQQSQLNLIEGLKNRVDKKFAATHKIKRKHIWQKNPFLFVPDYRAYFEKETKSSYEQYQQNHNIAIEKAITSKVNQLAKLQKDTKHQLLKRLEEQRFRFKKNTSRVIQSIAEVSSMEEGLPLDKSIISAACASNLNEQFSHINQFLASNHSFINEQSEINKNEKASKNTQSVTIPPPSAEVDQQTNGSRDKKRKERLRGRQGSSQRTGFEETSHEYQTRQNKPIDAEFLSKNKRQNIFANIEIVNKQCAEEQKIRIIESQRLQQERQERERIKMAKKEQQSNISSPYEPAKNEGYDENESERKRLESVRGTDWYNYHGKSNPKIKRLEILNRYHFNPFEENEGEDQCELWKKLMSMEIKNIKSENPSIKNEDFNNNLLDELYKAAEFSDNAKNRNSHPKDPFILLTNYKPQEIEKSNKEEQEEVPAMSQDKERDIKQKKTKPCKKQKKSHKNKKDKDEKDSKSGLERDNNASNNEPEIDDFLNLGPKEECTQTYQPKLEYLGNYSQSQRHLEPEYNFQPPVNQITHNNEPSFNFDQLPDLEGFENVKHDDRPDDDDEPLFQSEAPPYRDIEYFEGLASKRH